METGIPSARFRPFGPRPFWPITARAKPRPSVDKKGAGENAYRRQPWMSERVTERLSADVMGSFLFPAAREPDRYTTRKEGNRA